MKQPLQTSYDNHYHEMQRGMEEMKITLETSYSALFLANDVTVPNGQNTKILEFNLSQGFHAVTSSVNLSSVNPVVALTYQVEIYLRAKNNGAILISACQKRNLAIGEQTIFQINTGIAFYQSPNILQGGIELWIKPSIVPNVPPLQVNTNATVKKETQSQIINCTSISAFKINYA